MTKIILVFMIATYIAACNGIDVSNYEISRNKLGGFGIKDVLHYILGGGHGYYPGNNYPSGPGGHYPSGPGGHYPSGPGGHYPSGPGYYPGQHRPPGPPGAHAGCPLCDSSVYSYCSHKEAHDACCCSGSYGYGCYKSDCKFLYANTCQEYDLITSCCCVDLKNAVAAPVIAAPIA